jgi:hypothetical protein
LLHEFEIGIHGWREDSKMRSKEAKKEESKEVRSE